MLLTQEQVRVLGCLLEKERTTPDDYPLTANALMRASNQTTSRHPVVDYDLRTVERTLVELKESGLVRFVFSPSNRATKYRQILGDAWGCDEDELAVLCLLFLRGAQTAGELKTRSDRLASFASPGAVEAVLQRLAARPEPMVRLLERAPGQKEPRWAQLLGDEPPPETVAVRTLRGGVEADRVEALEARVTLLEAQLAQVRSELGIEDEPTPEGE